MFQTLRSVRYDRVFKIFGFRDAGTRRNVEINREKTSHDSDESSRQNGEL